MMTPKLLQSITSQTNELPLRKDAFGIKSYLEDKSPEVTYRKPISSKNAIEVPQSEEHTNLVDPTSHKIRCESSEPKLDTQNENASQNNLPHWLRLSALQIYPYNFIMAVRRKLEALADLKQERAQLDLMHNKVTSFEDSLINSTGNDSKDVPTIINEGTTLSINEESILSNSNELNIWPTKAKNYCIQPNLEVTSGLNSILTDFMPNTHTKALSHESVHIPLTYPIPKSETKPSDNDDGTTISSSIFNSPEKNNGHIKMSTGGGNIQDLQTNGNPLSLERVENLMIIRNENPKRAIVAKHVNPNRGDELQCSIIDDKLLYSGEIQTSMNHFLDDFNRSLSHVLAIHDRLKTTTNTTDNIRSIIENECDVHAENFAQSCSQQFRKSNSDNEYISNHTYIKGGSGSCSTETTKLLKIQSRVNEFERNRASEPNSRVFPSSSENYPNKEIILQCDRDQHMSEPERLQKEVMGNCVNNRDKQSEYLKTVSEKGVSMKSVNDKLKKCGMEKNKNVKSTGMARQAVLCKRHLLPNHKILETFNSPSLEISINSTNKDSFLSAFPNFGLCEKLIENKTTKSEYLTTLLKTREKALFDHTKRHISWLEVQKERYKSKGILHQITTIKKKQRGILLKMERERGTIKRLLQSTTPAASKEKSGSRVSQKPTHLNCNAQVISPIIPLLKSSSANLFSNYANFNGKSQHSALVSPANYSVESPRSLEELLQKRESDLRRRRQYVEWLMEWNRELDQEEAQVLQMENMVLSCKTHKIELKTVNDKEIDNLGNDGICSTALYTKTEQRLREIENSIKELSRISNAHTTFKCDDGSEEQSIYRIDNCVRISGHKLNKLWHRLTSQDVEKYRLDKQHKLSKNDLERLYEEAKVVVLNDFTRHDGRLADNLLEKSIPIFSKISSQASCKLKAVPVPPLNSFIGSGSSDIVDEPWVEASGKSLLLGNYRPEFRQLTCNSDSTGILAKNKSELNLQTTMKNLCHCTAHSVGLMRSISDTVLYYKERPRDVDIEILEIYQKNSKEKFNIAISDNAETIVTSPLSLSSSKQVLSHITNTTLNNANELFTLAPDPPTERPIVIPSVKMLTIGHICKDSDDLESNNEPGNIDSHFGNSRTVFRPQTSTCMDDIPTDFNVTLHQNMSSIISPDMPLQGNKLNSNSLGSNIKISNTDESRSQQASFNSKVVGNGMVSIQPEVDTTENELLSMYADDFEICSDESTQIDMSLSAIAEISQPEDICGQQVYVTDISNDGENIYLGKLSELSGINENPHKIQKMSDITKYQSKLSPPFLPISSTDDTQNQTTTQSSRVTTVRFASKSVQLMPDIINELEIRRCRQIRIESEHLEKSSPLIPYMYIREIPNKPPPPYVPPAHGSPMTTIFPPEERIRDISYRRAHEILCELLKTDYISENGEKLPSVMEEKITNIYERIVLDICCEYLEEHSDVLSKGNPANIHPQLAFFNPPNRLKCVQEAVYKEVRRCLSIDKKLNICTQINSVYGSRAKQDHIGKIIIQELHDEDSKWCNFHREENEVVELIFFDMIKKSITDEVEQIFIEGEGIIEWPNQIN